MKKTDIKPGVVYAHQSGKYSRPVPVVILGTDLFSTRARRETGGPWASPAASHAKPGYNSLYGYYTGYPAVKMDSGAQLADVLDRIQAVTLADFKASTGSHIDDDLSYVIIDRLAEVVGVYDKVMAEREDAERARRALARQELEREQASRTRAEDVLAALQAHGVEGDRTPRYGVATAITIPLAEAEKLVELLKDAS